MENSKSDNGILRFGYKAGIVMAFLCIVSAAIYLFSFLLTSPNPELIKSEFQLLSITAERRLLLLSIAMFIAMAFGFLGFSLFLIQVKGDLDAEASHGDYKIKLARISPGLFVILCATVIIIYSATFRIDYGLKRGLDTSNGQEPQPNNLDTEFQTNAPEVGDDQLVIKDSSKAKHDTTIKNIRRQ